MANLRGLDFKEINRAALAARLYRRDFPKGKRAGKEWQSGDIDGGTGHSFNINMTSGAWIENSTQKGGGDYVSLRAERDGLSQVEAARQLADELGLEIGQSASRPAKQKTLPEAPTTGDPAHVYPYHNANGTLAFEVLRYEKPGHKKAIRVKGTYDQAALYNAALAAKYSVIFVAEGEACCDALTAPGVDLVAVTNPGGSGRWRPEHSEHLRGKHVVILPDNDEPGRAHAAKVAESVYPLAASVKIFDLPGLPQCCLFSI